MIIALYAFWLILSQKITAEILIFGIIVVGAVFAFTCAAMGYSLRLELKLYKIAGLMICYALVLFAEVIKANLSVARLVLFRSESYKPVIVHVELPLKRAFTRTLMANSITLTPGTITVDENDGIYIVYCLDRPMAEGISQNTLCKILCKMEEALK